MKYLNDRGSATVSVAGLLVAILLLFSFAIAGVGTLITKHKLSSATDFAALSAAISLPQLTAACQVAQEQLTSTGFKLTNCQGGEHWVSISSSVQMSVLSYPITLNSEATAGW
jgi:secretion/DNA translocation related TadE-like protein